MSVEEKLWEQEWEKGMAPFLEHISLSSLRDAYGTLSAIYRDHRAEGTHRGIHQSPLFPLAYLMTRTPATLSVLTQILLQVQEFFVEKEPESFLDMGAGLGLSALLLKKVFPTLKHCTLVEPEPRMRDMGEKVLSSLSLSGLQWSPQGWEDFSSFPQQDLLLLSYVLNELSPLEREEAVREAWKKTKVGLILIEPGTPEGFRIIKEAREWLKEEKAFIVAPCLHHNSCPMEKGNWCHFRARLPREKTQRFLKGGSLGYEDEKFSYLVASPFPPSYEGEGRILTLPRKRPGHILMDICTREGQHEIWTWAKSHKNYSTMKEKTWGEIILERPKKDPSRA